MKPTGGVRPKTALPASVVSLLASLVFALLSQAEHTRTVRPSFLASGYLTLTILLDVAQARSLWLRPGLGSIAAMFTVALAVKVVMLVLEESSKASLLLQRVRGDGGEEHDEEVKYVALPAETTSGLFSRSLFWWLNSLLYQGFRTVIGMGDLGAIDEKFASDRVLRKAARTWDAANKRGKHALLWAMFAAFKSQFFAAVVPRLCFTGFLFAQPFLINRIIIFVGTPTDERSNSVAGGLIGATILVYVGIAVRQPGPCLGGPRLTSTRSPELYIITSRTSCSHSSGAPWSP